MRKYQVLIYAIFFVSVGLLDYFVIKSESIRMGIFSATFFFIIMVDRFVRRIPWCKNSMMVELIIAFGYLGIAGGLILGPNTVYFMEFSFVILIGLFTGLFKKQTVSYIYRMNFFENAHKTLSEKKAQDVRLYSQDKRFAIGLHFVIIMLYFLVLFFFHHFWILPLFRVH